MKYVYPKFDGIDLYFFRLGGSGLGNLLYPFFRIVPKFFQFNKL